MAKITFKGNPVNTVGELPQVGSKAPDFKLTKTDLSTVTLDDYKGKNLILNIYPSVDTGVCATSTKKFNENASQLEDTAIVCVSNDLPFAFSRFCGAEGIDNVEGLSAFKKDQEFENSYGVLMQDGPLAGLTARAIVVVDKEGTVAHTELVPDIVEEPNYEAALKAVK